MLTEGGKTIDRERENLRKRKKNMSVRAKKKGKDKMRKVVRYGKAEGNKWVDKYGLKEKVEIQGGEKERKRVGT